MKVNFFHSGDKTIEELVNDAVDGFSGKYKLNKDLELNVDFVTKKRIHALNKEYLKRDRPTNILSFPIWNTLSEIPSKDKALLGETVICLPVVIEEAKEYEKDFSKYLQELVVHSLNHLIGKHH